MQLEYYQLIYRPACPWKQMYRPAFCVMLQALSVFCLVPAVWYPQFVNWSLVLAICELKFVTCSLWTAVWYLQFVPEIWYLQFVNCSLVPVVCTWNLVPAVCILSSLPSFSYVRCCKWLFDLEILYCYIFVKYHFLRQLI